MKTIYAHHTHSDCHQEADLKMLMKNPDSDELRPKKLIIYGGGKQ